MSADTEQIVLVNEHGNPIGIAPKLASHHLYTPLHLAFSCYIINEVGELLVTQRATTKKVWPGVWTNSVCGHPAPGEAIEDAIARRAEFELGLPLYDVQLVLPDYRYKSPPYNGVIEHEICPVFVARTDAQPAINPEEVADYEWLSWQTYSTRLQDESELWSYWAKDQLQHLQESAAAKAFLSI